MSTGGITLLLAVNPHRFRGLTTIGTIVFLIDLVVFLTLTTLLLARFLMYPGTFTRSANHPTESLFMYVVTSDPLISPLTQFSTFNQPDILSIHLDNSFLCS